MPAELPSSGNDVHIVAKDRVNVTGVNPLIAPATRRDDIGEGVNNWGILSTSGLQSVYGARPTFQAIDNAGDHIGGNVTEVAQCRYNVNAGAGGINLTTNGNISLMAGGGLVEMTPTECFSCLSKNVNLTATESFKISAESMILDKCSPQFGGNAMFEKNMAVKGGAFVQGEAFLTHITTQREIHFTEPSDDCGGYLNPDKEFMIVGVGPMILNVAGVAGVSVLAGTFEGPGGSGPCSIQISNLNIITALAEWGVANARFCSFLPDALDPGAYDVVIPGHMHKYESIPVTFKENTSEVWDAAKVTLEDDPVLASPSQPNGMTKEEAVKKIVKKQTNKMKKFAKNLLKKAISPFW